MWTNPTLIVTHRSSLHRSQIKLIQNGKEVGRVSTQPSASLISDINNRFPYKVTLSVLVSGESTALTEESLQLILREGNPAIFVTPDEDDVGDTTTDVFEKGSPILNGSVLEGYLEKKGVGILAHFQKRYCVLKSDKLYYYKDKPEEGVEKERGTIELSGSTIRMEPNLGLSIEGQYTKRKFELQAPTEDIRKKWMNALQDAAVKTRNRAMSNAVEYTCDPNDWPSRFVAAINFDDPFTVHQEKEKTVDASQGYIWSCPLAPRGVWKIEFGNDRSINPLSHIWMKFIVIPKEMNSNRRGFIGEWDVAGGNKITELFSLNEASSMEMIVIHNGHYQPIMKQAIFSLSVQVVLESKPPSLTIPSTCNTLAGPAIQNRWHSSVTVPLPYLSKMKLKKATEYLQQQGVEEFVYEHWRKYPLQGWSRKLLPTDGPEFTDGKGEERRLEQVIPPEGWKWETDWVVSPFIDEGNQVSEWQYAVGPGQNFHNGKENIIDFYRRRRWGRWRIPGVSETDSPQSISKVITQHSEDHIDAAVQRLCLRADGDEIKINDKKKQAVWLKYKDELQDSLQSFDKAREWADVMKSLNRVKKVISSYTDFDTVPHMKLVAKRLSQSLNSSLPPGVHTTALDAYEYLFHRLGPRGISSELPYLWLGIFTLFSEASEQVKPKIVSLIQTHLLACPIQTNLTCLDGVFTTLLVGLEDNGSDIYGKILHIVDSLYEMMVEQTQDIEFENGKMMSPVSLFFLSLWRTVRFSIKSATGALLYIGLRLPPGKGTGITKLLPEHVACDSELVVCALIYGMDSDKDSTRKAAFDVVANQLAFPILEASPFIARIDALVLFDCSLRIAISRSDSSLVRRLQTWLLGGEAPTDDHLLQHSDLLRAMFRSLITGDLAIEDKGYHNAHKYIVDKYKDKWLILVQLFNVSGPEQRRLMRIVLSSLVTDLLKNLLGQTSSTIEKVLSVVPPHDIWTSYCHRICGSLIDHDCATVCLYTTSLDLIPVPDDDEYEASDETSKKIIVKGWSEEWNRNCLASLRMANGGYDGQDYFNSQCLMDLLNCTVDAMRVTISEYDLTEDNKLMYLLELIKLSEGTIRFLSRLLAKHKSKCGATNTVTLSSVSLVDAVVPAESFFENGNTLMSNFCSWLHTCLKGAHNITTTTNASRLLRAVAEDGLNTYLSIIRDYYGKVSCLPGESTELLKKLLSCESAEVRKAASVIVSLLFREESAISSDALLKDIGSTAFEVLSEFSDCRQPLTRLALSLINSNPDFLKDYLSTHSIADIKFLCCNGYKEFDLNINKILNLCTVENLGRPSLVRHNERVWVMDCISSNLDSLLCAITETAVNDNASDEDILEAVSSLGRILAALDSDFVHRLADHEVSDSEGKPQTLLLRVMKFLSAVLLRKHDTPGVDVPTIATPLIASADPIAFTSQIMALAQTETEFLHDSTASAALSMLLRLLCPAVELAVREPRLAARVRIACSQCVKPLEKLLMIPLSPSDLWTALRCVGCIWCSTVEDEGTAEGSKKINKYFTLIRGILFVVFKSFFNTFNESSSSIAVADFSSVLNTAICLVYAVPCSIGSQLLADTLFASVALMVFKLPLICSSSAASPTSPLSNSFRSFSSDSETGHKPTAPIMKAGTDVFIECSSAALRILLLELPKPGTQPELGVVSSFPIYSVASTDGCQLYKRLFGGVVLGAGEKTAVNGDWVTEGKQKVKGNDISVMNVLRALVTFLKSDLAKTDKRPGQCVAEFFNAVAASPKVALRVSSSLLASIAGDAKSVMSLHIDDDGDSPAKQAQKVLASLLVNVPNLSVESLFNVGAQLLQSLADTAPSTSAGVLSDLRARSKSTVTKVASHSCTTSLATISLLIQVAHIVTRGKETLPVVAHSLNTITVPGSAVLNNPLTSGMVIILYSVIFAKSSTLDSDDVTTSPLFIDTKTRRGYIETVLKLICSVLKGCLDIVKNSEPSDSFSSLAVGLVLDAVQYACSERSSNVFTVVYTSMSPEERDKIQSQMSDCLTAVVMPFIRAYTPTEVGRSINSKSFRAACAALAHLGPVFFPNAPQSSNALRKAIWEYFMDHPCIFEDKIALHFLVKAVRMAMTKGDQVLNTFNTECIEKVKSYLNTSVGFFTDARRLARQTHESLLRLALATVARPPGTQKGVQECVDLFIECCGKEDSIIVKGALQVIRSLLISTSSADLITWIWPVLVPELVRAVSGGKSWTEEVMFEAIKTVDVMSASTILRSDFQLHKWCFFTHRERYMEVNTGNTFGTLFIPIFHQMLRGDEALSNLSIAVVGESNSGSPLVSIPKNAFISDSQSLEGTAASLVQSHYYFDIVSVKNPAMPLYTLLTEDTLVPFSIPMEGSELEWAFLCDL